MTIGIVTNELRDTDGVTNHIYDLLCGFTKYYPEINFIILTPENSTSKFLSLPVDIICIPNFSYGERSRLNYLRAISSVLKIVKHKNIQILHSHNHYHANICADVSRLIKVKTAQTNHGLLEKTGRLKHFRADHYIIINQHIADYIQEQQMFETTKFDFIRCGISEAFFERKSDPMITTFLTAGRLVEDKGFETYIRAVVGIPADIKSKCKFLLAGEGPDETRLKMINDEINAEVEFLGNIANLREVLARTDVFVVPSISSTEGFPRVIVEAAFAENFIITSNFLGVQYDFENEKDGFMFPMRDHFILRDLFIRYIENRPYARDLQKNFTEKVVDIFSLKLMISKTKTVYDKLMH